MVVSKGNYYIPTIWLIHVDIEACITHIIVDLLEESY
jgi:hypothetical protein